MLEVENETTEDYATCRPVGEIDAYTVGQFREALTEHAEAPKLLIDLSQVPFIDSAGLGALIGGIRRVRENQGIVAVFCDREALIRLLHTTGFDRIVPVAESLDAAVDALNNPSDDA
ncbi:MAG: STAS domain-containing protein [Acidimicrobiales bacterium]|nr:STAS domain-containing protein [Acidimicrobiales bacterium]